MVELTCSIRILSILIARKAKVLCDQIQSMMWQPWSPSLHRRESTFYPITCLTSSELRQKLAAKMEFYVSQRRLMRLCKSKTCLRTKHGQGLQISKDFKSSVRPLKRSKRPSKESCLSKISCKSFDSSHASPRSCRT